MESAYRTAIQARSAFATHAEALVTMIAVVCIAGVCPLPCGGQTTDWNTNGSSIWYSPAGVNVGIGTTNPSVALEVLVPGGASTNLKFTAAPGGTGRTVGQEFWATAGDAAIHNSGRIESTFIGTMTYPEAVLSLQTPTGAGTWATALTARNGNVGIGTASPSVPLEVLAPSGAAANVKLSATGGTGRAVGQEFWATAGDAAAHNSARIESSFTGTMTYPEAVLSLQTPTGAGTWVTALTAKNGNVGIGTTNPTYALSVNGTIQAKEVVVNTGWSDYVFHPAYRLKPLGEVAAYIQQNHHLPDIPSDAEVRENGVSLGEMQSKLLAKIEELTLHVIQEHDRNDRLERQNAKMLERLARLEGRTAR